MSVEVFYSYSHKDDNLRAELENHLSLLKRTGVISEWHDRRIGPGQEWGREIDAHLESAKIILLLISADFLASDYCYDREMRRALERHERGEAIVIPVLLRPVLWDTAPFASLQALPTGATPVTSWSNRDEAFRDIAAGIRDAAVRVSRATPPAANAAFTRLPIADTSAQRVLDAAIPKNVTVGQAAELLIQIRRTDSGGLRAIVAADPDTDAEPEDVRSNDFALEFPRGPDGRLAPLRVKVSVDAPDFQPPRSEKTIVVPSNGDTEVVTFLLTPARAGRLTVCVEIGWQEAVRAARLVRTNAGAASAAVAGPSGMTVVSMPLFTVSAFTGVPRAPVRPSGPTAIFGADRGAPDEANIGSGEFTKMFRQPGESRPADSRPSGETSDPTTPPRTTATTSGGSTATFGAPSGPTEYTKTIPRQNAAPSVLSRTPWRAAAAAVVVIGCAVGVWSIVNGPTATITSAAPPTYDPATAARHKTSPHDAPRFTLDVLDTTPAGRGKLRINVRYDVGDLKPTGSVFIDAQPLDSAGQVLHYIDTVLGDAPARSGTAAITVRNTAPKEREPHSWKICFVEKPAGSGDTWSPVLLGCRIVDTRIYLPPGAPETTRE